MNLASHLAFAAVFAVALLMPAPAGAQTCFLDDGLLLPGACCVPVSPTLPVFPAQTIVSRGACFLDCAVESAFPVTIGLGTPFPFTCDVYAVPITIFGTVSTAPAFMVAKYQRTWQEVGTGGTLAHQVWRFLVNVDVTYTSTAPAPCPRPTCTLAGVPVHLVGSLDYALDCATGAWSSAINLTHHCGELSHGPFSSRVVPVNLAHRERLYAFAGPAPFNFDPAVPPSSAPTLAGSVRSTAANLTTSPLIWQCFSEELVFSGLQTDLGTSCPCAATAMPIPRWHDVQLGFQYGCTSASTDTFTTLPGWSLAPSGLRAFPLGTYVGPVGSYPSGESVQVYFGVASSPDPCPPGIFPIHIVQGVGTRGGNPMIGGLALANDALDLANTLIPNTTFGLNIGYGSLFVSTLSWSLFF